MRPPLGYTCLPSHICHLRKSLYGLKQAPRVWFENFRGAILRARCYQSPNDNSIFIRRTGHGCTILLLYVDDMIISGNDISCMTDLKASLMRSFKMKHLAPLTYFLGLETSRSKDGICIHQRKYAEDLISLAHLTNTKVIKL